MDSEAITPQKPQTFLWNAGGGGVSALLSGAVLDAIRTALAQSASPTPEEFGGILLGSSESEGGETYRTRVDGFEIFTIEHRYGQSFSLSLRDQKRLRQRLERLERGPRRPVGFFRSHLRRGLYVDQRDFDLFQSEFRNPAAIFLLVRPDEGERATGGIFIWEGEDMRRHSSYLEFPLEGRGLQPVARPEPAVPARTVVAVRPRVHELPGLSWQMPRVAWKLPALNPEPAKLRAGVLVLLAVGLPLAAFYLGRDVGLRERRPEDETLPRRAAASQRAGRLHVQPAESADVATAPAPDLRTALAADALFAVPKPDEGPPDESVRAPQAVGRNTENTRSYRERTGEPGAVKAHARPVWHATQVRGAAPPKLLPEPPEVAANASVPSVPPLPAMLLRTPGLSSESVVAYLKPAHSGIRGALRKVPLLRALGGKSETFVPASPLEHPLPAVEKVSRRAGKNSVEFEARIDRAGRVVAVKSLQGNSQLVGVSADALHRWRFEPARQNGEPVESEMLVRFEFSDAAR